MKCLKYISKLRIFKKFRSIFSKNKLTKKVNVRNLTKYSFLKSYFDWIFLQSLIYDEGDLLK